MLTPTKSTWTESIIFSFAKSTGTNPVAGLTWNHATHTLYGTARKNAAEFRRVLFRSHAHSDQIHLDREHHLLLCKIDRDESSGRADLEPRHQHPLRHHQQPKRTDLGRWNGLQIIATCCKRRR